MMMNSRCAWCGCTHDRNSAFCSAECSWEYRDHSGVRIVEHPGEDEDEDVELDDDDVENPE